MVPEMGWRNQPPTEAIADALFLLKSEKAKAELLDSAQNGTRAAFVKTCAKWEKMLPDQKDLIVKFRSSVHLLCFDSRYNRIGQINQTTLDTRLSQLQPDLEQEIKSEAAAKKFVTHINGADISGAKSVLASTNLKDLKKIQQSKYYKKNVNLKSPEGKTVDNIVNSYVQDKTKSTPASKKSITQSTDNLSKIHESILNPTIHIEPQEKRIENAARKFIMHLNADDLNGAQDFLAATNANDLSKIQQSKYYKENVNLDSPKGKAINDVVNCYVKDKVKSTPETKKSLAHSFKNLIKTIAKKLNNILKSTSSKNNKSAANVQNNRQRKGVSSIARSM